MHPCWVSLCLVLYFFIYEVWLLGLLLMQFPSCNTSLFTLFPRLQPLSSGLARETPLFWVSCCKHPHFVSIIFIKSVWLHLISCHGDRQTRLHPAVARFAFCSQDCFYTCPWFGQHPVSQQHIYNFVAHISHSLLHTMEFHIFLKLLSFIFYITFLFVSSIPFCKLFYLLCCCLYYSCNPWLAYFNL
jgi:hypothetical protein